MRLFIAIECPETVKAALEEQAALVRSACVRGTFTRREQFHLTLAFLGQVSSQRTREIAALMDDRVSPPIPITIGHMGRFRRREGDILWRQIEADAGLIKLQRTLAAALRAHGFALEARAFQPHLTLARRVILKNGVKLSDLSAAMPDLTYAAAHITLMRSHQVNGKLVYTPLHRTALNAKS